MEKQKITGSEALLKSLIAEGVDTIFGYPGGQAIPIYDSLYDYRDKLKHVLVRHEQGATHAAQGYARVSGKVGVTLVTSGPGATNTITGIADALMDSTPMVVIAGQVPSPLLGTDAFQEVDVIGITQPITKWAYQIRKPEEIAWAVSRAFYIASTGRPGPVVLDLAKDAQVGFVDYEYKKVDYIRSYQPEPDINQEIYGLPGYLSAIPSALLNESATLFRRKYYINGSHAGFIMYMTDAAQNQEDVNNLRNAMKSAKGPGNFRNLFMYSPNGKKDGLQIIPLSEVAAKDEFLNIKNVSRDDMMAAHRVPPQMMGIMPSTVGGFGDVEKASRVFVRNELIPLQERMKELNNRL